MSESTVTLPEVSISLTDLARQPEFALTDLSRANACIEDSVQSALSAQSQARFHRLESADSMIAEAVELLRKANSQIVAASLEAHRLVTSSTEKRLRREAVERFIETGA